MLECLSPLFRMDYLLPRSFVAALEFEQLKDVVPTELIPVEVTLAGLYYFSKKHKVTTHKNEVRKNGWAKYSFFNSTYKSGSLVYTGQWYIFVST